MKKPTGFPSVGSSSVLRRRLTTTSLFALSLLSLVALSGCGADAGAPDIGQSTQRVRIDPGSSSFSINVAYPTGDPVNGPFLGLADFIPTSSTNPDPIPAPEGHYSVTMEFEEFAVDFNVTLTVDGDTANAVTFTVPASMASSKPLRVSRELVFQQDATAKTAMGTLQVSAGAVLNTMIIAPLRKTNVVNPDATGFSPSDGGPLSGSGCSGCHWDKVAQWRSSMMGYSSISPPIHALELTENHVDVANEREDLRDDTSTPAPGFGRFSRSPVAPTTFESEVHGQRGSSLFCQRCHAPSATFTDTLRVFDLDYSQPRGSIPDNHELLSFLIETDFTTFDPTDEMDPGFKYVALLRDYDPDPNNEQYFFQPQSSPDVMARVEQLQTNARAGAEGVTCTVCHSINGIDRDATAARTDPLAEAGIGNSGFRVAHFDDTDSVRVNFGPFDDHELPNLDAHFLGQANGMLTGTDGMMRPFIQTGEMCGTCHDVRIGDDDYGMDGVRGTGDDSDFRRVENLFTEWRDSPWNNNNSEVADNLSTFENPRAPSGNGNLKTATTCQDCHMSKYITHEGARPGEFEMQTLGGKATRNSNHRFVGVDRFLIHDIPLPSDLDATPPSDFETELSIYDISQGRTVTNPVDTSLTNTFDDFEDPGDGSNDDRDLREILLQKAAELKIESVGTVAGDQLPVTVSVHNVGVGHNLPAGLSQERQVWIELEVLDANGDHVYTSGYMNPVDDPNNPDPDKVPFNPSGSLRYEDSYCASLDGDGKRHEYECELDFFRVPDNAEIGPDLSLQPNTPGQQVQFVSGDDPMLKNYQNGFTLGQFNPSDKLQNKVLTQFIGSHIVNDNSLTPFEKRFEQYMIPVSKVPAAIRNGPYTINAKLRFRPLPLEFLEGLKKAFETNDPNLVFRSRIDEDVIKNNVVIEMEQDHCVSGGFATSSLRPCARVDSGFSSVLAAGAAHTCIVYGDDIGDPDAFSDDGIDKQSYARYTQCFGDNGLGQVGIGSTIGTGGDQPAAVTIDLINQSTVTAGQEHSCALHRGGTVACWGNGAGGRLGDNDTSSHISTGPREINQLSDVSSIASAASSTCAVKKGATPADDSVLCWGSGTSGELGSGTAGSDTKYVPTEIVPMAGGIELRGIQQIAAGEHHYCVVAQGDKLDEEGNTSGAYSEGHVYCWGASLGNAQSSNTGVAARVDVPYQTKKLVAGEDFTCALTVTGDAYCWGSNANGRLGIGDSSVTSTTTPTKLAISESVALDLVAGKSHGCVYVHEPFAPVDSLKCWGSGANYKLGNESTSDEYQPTFVHYDTGTTASPDYFTGIVAMAAGDDHTCVVTNGPDEFFAPQGVWCWGDNSHGQLGMPGEPGPVTYAKRLEFSDTTTLGDLPNPMLQGRSYYASEDRGGPGDDGCVVELFQQCVDELDLVDVNAGDNFRYVVDAFGGMTELHFEISKLDNYRKAEVFLNNAPTGQYLEAFPGEAQRLGTAPNRTGLLLPPITLNLLPGLNTIDLVDNQGTPEFDMHRVRLIRTEAGTCFDLAQNGGETGLNCGGPYCAPCGTGDSCNVDSDCVSGDCEGNVCQPPTIPDPSSGPCGAYAMCDGITVLAAWNANGGNYQSQHLGFGNTCREVKQFFNGMWCGNFTSGKQFFIDNQQIFCNPSGNTTPPAPIPGNGGYCMRSIAGSPDTDNASYALWDETSGTTPLP